MKLIIGLGNPGQRYSKTRHNLGFMLVDRLAEMYEFDFSKNLFKAIVAEGLVRETGELYSFSEKVVLVKPQTYMNLSGESVVSLYQWYKVEIKDVLVICDDFSLPAGSLRFRIKGGDGGHNGLKSIINLLGTKDFPRLRIGIARDPEMADADYVLSKLSEEEMKNYNLIIDKAAQGVDCFIKHGIDKAMNMYNASF